jgi:hypothetical protein
VSLTLDPRIDEGKLFENLEVGGIAGDQLTNAMIEQAGGKISF